MNGSLGVLLVLLGVAYAAVDTGITSRSVCTVSGDPHWKTFDGVKTDPQGTGVYTMAENTFFRVQCRTHRCNARARRPVTCLSWCSFGVKKLGAVVAGAAWGSRSAQPQYAAIDNFAQQDAFASTVDDVQLLLPADVAPPRGCTQQDAGPPIRYSCPSNVNYDIVITPGWKFQFRRNRMSLFEVDGNDQEILNGNNFYYQRHYLRLYASNTPQNQELCTCGYFNNDPTFEFVRRTDFTVYAASTHNSRVNGPSIQEWFASHAITSDADLTLPIPSAHGRGEVMAVPAPEGPTTDQALYTQELDFKNDAHFQQAQDLCNEITSVNAEAQFATEACLLDAALMSEDGVITDNAKEMMQSANLAAAQTQPNQVNQVSTSDDGLTDGEIAGAVVGTVAGVSLLIAGVVYYRLHTTKRHLSQALSLVNGGTAAGSSGDIRLADNL